jgi:hypothetical protein
METRIVSCKPSDRGTESPSCVAPNYKYRETRGVDAERFGDYGMDGRSMCRSGNLQ